MTRSYSYSYNSSSGASRGISTGGGYSNTFSRPRTTSYYSSSRRNPWDSSSSGVSSRYTSSYLPSSSAYTDYSSRRSPYSTSTYTPSSDAYLSSNSYRASRRSLGTSAGSSSYYTSLYRPSSSTYKYSDYSTRAFEPSSSYSQRNYDSTRLSSRRKSIKAPPSALYLPSTAADDYSNSGYNKSVALYSPYVDKSTYGSAAYSYPSAEDIYSPVSDVSDAYTSLDSKYDFSNLYSLPSRGGTYRQCSAYC